MEYLWIFLIVIAGMVVGFLVIVVVAFLLVKYWLRRVMKQWIDVAEEATKGIVPFMQPLRIKLEAESDPAWNDEASMKRLTKAMKSAGFVDAGIFRIDEVPDICLKALVQPEKSVYAVIYEHPDKGIWFEYFARFEDGTSLTYSTSEATGLDRPPGRGIERFEPDEDASELYQRYLKQLTNKVLLPASIELFVSDFERGYAEEMDWRFERGGFTEDEIRNNLKRLGDDTTDEQIKQVHAMQQAQVGQWLMTKLKENFRATATITDAKWRKIEGRVIFVHDRLTNDEVQGMFTNCLDWDDDDAASEMAEKAETLTKKNSPREAFARMLPMLPADRAVKKLGHVTEPVAADVYLLSEVMVEEVE